MATWNRPLPGVRLGERRIKIAMGDALTDLNVDEPGDLAPGWEWHISPLGRSYFVDHNTRTTSWKKAVHKRPAGSLTPERVIEGHSKIIWKMVCAGRSCNILSGSRDESIRQWRRDGKLVGKPWHNDGGEVCWIPPLSAPCPLHSTLLRFRLDLSVSARSCRSAPSGPDDAHPPDLMTHAM